MRRWQCAERTNKRHGMLLVRQCCGDLLHINNGSPHGMLLVRQRYAALLHTNNGFPHDALVGMQRWLMCRAYQQAAGQGLAASHVVGTPTPRGPAAYQQRLKGFAAYQQRLNPVNPNYDNCYILIIF